MARRAPATCSAKRSSVARGSPAMGAACSPAIESVRMASAVEHGLERRGDLVALRAVEDRFERAVLRELLAREDQLVARERGVALGEDLLDARDRGDVVDVLGDIGLDLRV